MSIDKAKLRDELTEAFIKYQHNQDAPFPLPIKEESEILRRYQVDTIFRYKVDSLVSGVLYIVDKCTVNDEV